MLLPVSRTRLGLGTLHWAKSLTEHALRDLQTQHGKRVSLGIVLVSTAVIGSLLAGTVGRGLPGFLVSPGHCDSGLSAGTLTLLGLAKGQQQRPSHWSNAKAACGDASNRLFHCLVREGARVVVSRRGNQLFPPDGKVSSIKFSWIGLAAPEKLRNNKKEIIKEKIENHLTRPEQRQPVVGVLLA